MTTIHAPHRAARDAAVMAVSGADDLPIRHDRCDWQRIDRQGYSWLSEQGDGGDGEQEFSHEGLSGSAPQPRGGRAEEYYALIAREQAIFSASRVADCFISFENCRLFNTKGVKSSVWRI
jgi:hypothetical protein